MNDRRFGRVLGTAEISNLVDSPRDVNPGPGVQWLELDKNVHLAAIEPESGNLLLLRLTPVEALELASTLVVLVKERLQCDEIEARRRVTGYESNSNNFEGG